MSNPFGETRTRVAWNHALIGRDGHVPSLPPGWMGATGVVLISPALRGGPGGPRFCQYLVRAQQGCVGLPAPAGVERLVYVLQGATRVGESRLERDGFAWLPPGSPDRVEAQEGAELLVFEKPYELLIGERGPVAPPQRVSGDLASAPTEPFLGDPDAMLATLLPVEPAFDMAVNVFRFKPGTTLPFVETHVMEHGLYMRSGQGVYRLGDQWHPVTEGDTIWMASYCPQWFVAMGKTEASYVYYKDIHRDPLTRLDA